MAVKDLHEAAVVLKGAYQAIEKLLDETEPLEREHLQRSNILLTNSPGTPQTTFDAMDVESGYKAFYFAVEELIVLLGGVDMRNNEERARAVEL